MVRKLAYVCRSVTALHCLSRCHALPLSYLLEVGDIGVFFGVPVSGGNTSFSVTFRFFPFSWLHHGPHCLQMARKTRAI